MKQVGRLDINKLVNIPTSFNNLKTKVNYSDLSKLRQVPIDLKN